MLQEIGKIQYRGFTITILQTPPTRFGILYECINDIGEPKLDSSAYNTKQKAIDAEKLIIDEYKKQFPIQDLLLTKDDYFFNHVLDQFVEKIKASMNFTEPEYMMVGGKMVKEYSTGHYSIYKDASGTFWFDSGNDIEGMIDDLVAEQKFYE